MMSECIECVHVCVCVGGGMSGGSVCAIKGNNASKSISHTMMFAG